MPSGVDDGLEESTLDEDLEEAVKVVDSFEMDTKRVLAVGLTPTGAFARSFAFEFESISSIRWPF